MALHGSVQFLNVDLLIGGRSEKKPLLDATSDGVFVLHEDAFVENHKCLLLEVSGPRLDLPETVMRLVEWVEALPLKARRSWSRAAIRRLDIGIQAGTRPHETHWTIPRHAVSALANIGADLTLTIYGTEGRKARPRATGKPLPWNRYRRQVG